MGFWKRLFGIVEEAKDRSTIERCAESDVDTVSITGCPAAGWWWDNVKSSSGDQPEFEAFDVDPIRTEIAKRLIDKSIALIEVPKNVMEVLRLLDEDDFDFNEIADHIERSPTLLGEFLKVANSAQFSRGRKITNLRLILPRLGRSNVKSMLYLSSSKMSLPTHELFHTVASEIIEHSMAVGRIAEYLSQRYYTDPTKAFLTGLVHDVGKMAILKEISEKMELPEKIDFGFSESLFNNVFPELHQDAGELIGSYWQLDGEILKGIKRHHDESFATDSDSMLLPALINFSDVCARMLGFGRAMEAVDPFSLSSAKALYVEDNVHTRVFLQNVINLFENKRSPSEITSSTDK